MQPEMRTGGTPCAGLSTSQTQVTSGGQLVLSANATRRGVIVTNGGSATAYYGNSSAVTISTGQILLPSATISVSDPLYQGPLYMVTSGATVTTVGTAEFTP